MEASFWPHSSCVTLTGNRIVYDRAPPAGTQRWFVVRPVLIINVRLAIVATGIALAVVAVTRRPVVVRAHGRFDGNANRF
jgi:hypothetical protein